MEELLKDAIRIDGLLLRLALAERTLGLAPFPLHVESLKVRFAASRKLLEAALAAHDPQAAEPVLEMLKSTTMEDIQLRRLAAKFKESP